MSDHRITIRIEEPLQKRLAKLAKAAGKTESEVVREALDDYLPRMRVGPTCLELFKQAGVIGCVKGGPGDVSTNPKYMAGFGRE